MSLVAVLEVHVKPEQLSEARTVFATMLGETRDFDGCEGVEVLVDTRDEGHWLVVERWRDREADAAYRAWRKETGGVSALGELLAAAPAIDKYELSGV